MHPGYSLQTQVFLGYLVQMHVLRYSQTDLSHAASSWERMNGVRSNQNSELK